MECCVSKYMDVLCALKHKYHCKSGLVYCYKANILCYASNVWGDYLGIVIFIRDNIHPVAMKHWIANNVHTLQLTRFGNGCGLCSCRQKWFVFVGCWCIMLFLLMIGWDRINKIFLWNALWCIYGIYFACALVMSKAILE